MDTISGAEAGRRLETSVPRVVRAAKRLGVGRRGPGGRLSLTLREFGRLKSDVGVTPRIDGLSRIQVMVLAALARAPLGLASARVVAARAGVSPTAASRALAALETVGLVARQTAIIAAGRPRSVELLHANFSAERWPRIAPKLARVAPPKRGPVERERRVPRRLRHLYWNTAPEQLAIDLNGPYIARRLLTTGDLEGLSWGAANLRPSDWKRAARGRGLDPRKRALARNLGLGVGA